MVIGQSNWAVFNLPAEIIDFIKLEYKYPTAGIYTNNLLSGKVILERGNRQGCHFFLLLFDLAMEPFTEKIRQDPKVTVVNTNKYKQTTI